MSDFRLKINLWSLFDNYDSEENQDFFLDLCSILEEAEKLQQFKHLFIDSILKLDLDENVTTKLERRAHQMKKHSKVSKTPAIWNLSTNTFLKISNCLTTPEILNLQKCNRDLLIACHNPLVFKHKNLDWNYDRYLFEQNLSQWLFSKVEEITLDFSYNLWYKKVKYHRDLNLGTMRNTRKSINERVEDKVNEEWRHSVSTLRMIYQHKNNLFLPMIFGTLFENVRRLYISCYRRLPVMKFIAWNVQPPFFKEIRILDLEKIHFSMALLKFIVQCIHMEDLRMDTALSEDNGVLDVSEAASIIKTLKVKKIRKMRIYEDLAGEYNTGAKLIRQLLRKSECTSIDFELKFRQSNKPLIDLLFMDKFYEYCFKLKRIRIFLGNEMAHALPLIANEVQSQFKGKNRRFIEYDSFQCYFYTFSTFGDKKAMDIFVKNIKILIRHSKEFNLYVAETYELTAFLEQLLIGNSGKMNNNNMSLELPSKPKSVNDKLILRIQASENIIKEKKTDEEEEKEQSLEVWKWLPHLMEHKRDILKIYPKFTLDVIFPEKSLETDDLMGVVHENIGELCHTYNIYCRTLQSNKSFRFIFNHKEKKN